MIVSHARHEKRSSTVWINEYMMAARSAPRSDPAKNQDLRSRAMPRNARQIPLRMCGARQRR